MNNKERIDRLKKSKSKTYLLVDSENINSQWIDIAKILLDENSSTNSDSYYRNSLDPLTILIFYTENSERTVYNLGYENLSEISNVLSNSWPFRCNIGNSALDFQLSSVAGLLIGRNPDSEYIILSKDKGYDPVVAFWKEMGVNVCRKIPENYLKTQDTQSDDLNQDKKLIGNMSKSEKKAARDKFIKTVLPGYSEKQHNLVKSIISNKNQSKDTMKKTLVKKFGKKEGNDISNRIFPHLKVYLEYLK